MYIKPAKSFLKLINVDKVSSFEVHPLSGSWEIVAESGSGERLVILDRLNEQEHAERLALELAALTGKGYEGQGGAKLIEWNGSEFTVRSLS